MAEDVVVTILTDVANEQGLDIERLSREEAGALRRLSASRFGEVSTTSLTTENLRDFAKITTKDSWERIGEFPWSGPVILATNPRDTTTMFRCFSIADALHLLAEAPPFDFLLMDSACSFLFAHDQYDNLFGCGAAKEFLEQICETQ